MDDVLQGAHGFNVLYLQRLLNKAGVDPDVFEDGAYGGQTDRAVTTYQSTHGMRPTPGRAPRALFTTLGLRTEIVHAVRQMGQPTNMSCWSIAMTMARGVSMSIGRGNASTGLNGGLESTPGNIATFARENGMRVLSQMRSVPVSQLVSYLRAGPLVVIGAGRNGSNPWVHASVVSGIFSDDAPDASGTMLRIHDPWPPGSHGRVYGVFYSGGRQDVPESTYDLFGAYILGR